MLINHVPGEECRIALVEDGQLEELYQERQSSESHVGNIYKGRVSNVEPSIQAAFIDFGLERNGFLHITDLHPRYFPGNDREETERVGKKTPHRHRPPIQQCLKRGQEILVQVIKEGIGTKGPTLSSYLSIAGRYLVMMPHMERLGVSRKIEDEDLRRSLRKTLDELDVPDGFGFIIRTAGIEKTKTDLKRDLSYLQRLWKAIDRRMKQPGVGELYTEQDLVIRTLRDVFTTDIKRIIVDDAVAAKRASDFLAIASPRARSKVLYYSDPVPIYDRFGIEKQIETIQSRHVPLKSGGSLVIDSTEALVAIDVNSGKMRQHKNSDTTAYKTNQEACDEICRQLRLRDLGGVVVIDLIDMRESKKRRSIETQFRDNLKKDRARTKVLNISQLGLLEMTRQRMRPSLKKSVYNDCEQCHGTGHVKSIESVVLEAMRRLSVVMSRSDINRVEITVSPNIAFQLLNRKRADIVAMEQQSMTQVLVRVNSVGSIDFIEINAFNDNGAVSADGSERKGEPALTPVSDLTEEQLAEAQAVAEQVAEQAAVDAEAETEASTDDSEGAGTKKKRRRRRRRKKKSDSDGESSGSDTEPVDAVSDKEAEDDEQATQVVSTDDDPASTTDDNDEAESTGKKKRRRRRRRKKKTSTEAADEAASEMASEGDATEPADEASGEASGQPNDSESAADEASAMKKKRTRRRKKSKSKKDAAPSAEADTQSTVKEPKQAKKSKAAKKQADTNTKATGSVEVSGDPSDDKGSPATVSRKKTAKKSAKRTTKKKSASRKVYPPPAARRSSE